MISPASPPSIIKADAAAPTVTKVELNFFNDCGVSELARKINLDLSGIPKIKKSQNIATLSIHDWMKLKQRSLHKTFIPII